MLNCVPINQSTLSGTAKFFYSVRYESTFILSYFTYLLICNREKRQEEVADVDRLEESSHALYRHVLAKDIQSCFIPQHLRDTLGMKDSLHVIHQSSYPAQLCDKVGKK